MKFIRHQIAFAKHSITVIPRNLKRLSDIITYHDTIDQNTFDITVAEVLCNITNEEGNHIFDAVVPHGQKPHTTILMITNHNIAMMYRKRHNLLQVAQETFPDLNMHNLFTRSSGPTEKRIRNTPTYD